ncbi:hypothetical protein HanXRQr2_Chr07g0315541 [Helianthus annuus]|uniref:Uncharacterized protein n=1 Tax=Helianthus annuus TaxID=4232 RepID=A0A9K3IQ09_HELAN|nr:hypothetical protein HanXRQr2_Chr07g0315541 [Helianthus annuus]KAJ0906358.1 hypothetical protein HanPSC8_Chr07g0304581 [Helianthus annuus]
MKPIKYDVSKLQLDCSAFINQHFSYVPVWQVFQTNAFVRSIC